MIESLDSSDTYEQHIVMPQTIRDRRRLRQAQVVNSQELARAALQRVRDEAIAASDDDLARQAEVAGNIDWARLGASVDGRIAVHHLVAAVEQATRDAPYMTTGEAATVLGVSINTLKKWVRLGLIRDAYRTDGGHLRVAAADVARVTRLNRELDEAPDLRPIELDRPATPWNR